MKNAHRASTRRRIFHRLTQLAILWLALIAPKLTNAQPLQTVNMAIPAKSFQMAIYPIAQQKGYMKEEGIDQRVIFIAPTTSIQAMLGGDAHFTGAGSSALVSIARANTPLKVVVATNDRVLQWFVTRPDITSPKDLKGKKIATTGVAAIATFMIKQVLSKHGIDGNKDPVYLDVGQGNQLTALLSGGRSGFNAVLGGNRSDGRYARLEAHGFYWTASANDPATAPFYNFGKNGGALHRQPQGEKEMAISVRCIRK